MKKTPAAAHSGQTQLRWWAARGSSASSFFCMQCRCCSKSTGNSQITTCTSGFQCDPAGKCHLVQNKCGCSDGN